MKILYIVIMGILIISLAAIHGAQQYERGFNEGVTKYYDERKNQ